MEINEILEKLKNLLENDDFENIDSFLEELYSDEDSIEELYDVNDILQEATLYSEFKEETYKEEALNLIDNF